MNKEVRGTIGAIRSKLNQHAASVDAAMSVYRRDLEYAKREAAKYKDEAAELKERKARLVSSARAQIADADKELAESVKYHIGKLKEYVAEHIGEKPPRDFIDTLRIFKEFGLTMERSEVDSLILSAQGNYTGLRALSAVAKQCGGWQVSAPSTEAYNKQIARLNKFAEAPINYCSMDYVSEACDIYDRVYYIRPDGSKYTVGERPSTIHMITEAGLHTDLMQHLETMADEWGAAFIPQIESLENEYEKNEDGDTVIVTPQEQHQRNIKDAAGQIEVKDNEAERAAAQIGQRRADADRQAKEILAKYL